MSSSQAKRDFGSFHSSNVQELLTIPENLYVPPELPFDRGSRYTDEVVQFGTNAKKKYFLLEEDCTFLNHGAFGAVLKDALEAAKLCQTRAERQPLRFYDREVLPHLAYVTRRLAQFVGCNARDLVLVTNATTALNTVIQSIPLTEGDNIFCLSTTYGAVKKMLKWVCEKSGASLQEVTVNFPVKDKLELIDCVKQHLHEGTKLAVFDHIPSKTPFIMPLDEIIPIGKQRNVPVLVDGAHALGALPLNITALDPDYYVSNAHKWFSCPKGSAFLYVRRELQEHTRPLIISHGFGSGFNSEFIWTGLHDYSPFLAMHVVLDFWTGVGPDNIRQYMYNTCRDAGRLLCKRWGTSLIAPENMFGCMTSVQLPKALYPSDEVDYSDAETIQNTLYHTYNIEVPISCTQSQLYVRISAHIYNELSEYEKLADAVLEMCREKSKDVTGR